MKKLLAAGAALTLVLALGTTALAADSAPVLCGRGACAFVDEDGDGVCDNRGSGRYFVDEDGDGVCDNRGGMGCGRQGGFGRGSGCGRGCGRRSV